MKKARVQISKAIRYVWACPVCREGNVKVSPFHVNVLRCERCHQIIFRWSDANSWQTIEEGCKELLQPIISGLSD